jgi:hypothetical protein
MSGGKGFGKAGGWRRQFTSVWHLYYHQYEIAGRDTGARTRLQVSSGLAEGEEEDDVDIDLDKVKLVAKGAALLLKEQNKNWTVRKSEDGLVLDLMSGESCVARFVIEERGYLDEVDMRPMEMVAR